MEETKRDRRNFGSRNRLWNASGSATSDLDKCQRVMKDQIRREPAAMPGFISLCFQRSVDPTKGSRLERGRKDDFACEIEEKCRCESTARQRALIAKTKRCKADGRRVRTGTDLREEVELSLRREKGFRKVRPARSQEFQLGSSASKSD